MEKFQGVRPREICVLFFRIYHIGTLWGSVEHAVAPGWVDPDVDWLYISISRPQPAGSWYEAVHKVSSNHWAVGTTPQWPDADLCSGSTRATWH